MKELRHRRKGKKDSGKSAKNLETIVVQCLSAEVSSSWETQGLLAGTMLYFRASDIFGAKVYYKS